jgi:glycosyltransferase 2 family protein
MLTGLGLRLAITALVFAYLFKRIDISEVGDSLARISPLALLGGVGGALIALGSGLVRWRVLFGAYGARALPGWAELARLYMIAQFYNLLPGAVGGDVVRGYATRRYFDDAGAVRSVGVVLVDRLLGFLGLLLVASIATLTSPLPAREVLTYAALGLLAALGAVTAMTLARRLADVLPERIARLARMLPELHRPSLFAVAVALSLLSHIGVSLAGFAILAGVAPQVRLLEALVIFPLGALAAYFPLTFAGAGARDAALIFLCAQYGVARGDALAASLSLLLLQLSIAAVGGLVNLRSPAPVVEPTSL